MLKLSKNILKITFGIMFILLIQSASSELYTLEFNQIDNRLVIKESLDHSSNLTLDPEYLETNNKYLYLTKKIDFSRNYSEVIIRINLEKGVIIKEGDIFPEGYSLGTNGESIFVEWKLYNMSKGNSFPIFLKLEDTKKSDLSLQMIFLFLIAIGLIIIKFFKDKSSIKPAEKFKPQSKNNLEKDLNEKYEHLLDTEKKVIEELRKAKRNELWQRQLQNLTGFSKAKISRLIRDLEARGLVRKINFGNTNKIRLR